MRAVIPVAGVGTRLRPHTYSLPKVLLNVAGKPILAHILDALIAQGVSKATIITGYMGKMVEEFVQKRYDIDFDFVVQEEMLGLGHAIWTAKHTYTDEPLMIILGDTIFDVDLSLALNSENSSIGVKEVEDPRRFGVVLPDETGFIQKMIEKPDELIPRLAIVGIYHIKNPSLLIQCLDDLIKKNIKTRDEYQLTDALQMMLERGEKMTTFPVDGWYDCGKPLTLLSTNRFLLDKRVDTPVFPDAVIVPPVYIAPNARIERSIIGPYATIADGACVTDSVVRDSIISDGATVAFSLLEKSIIGNNAIVKGDFTRMNVGDSSEIKHA